MLLPVALLCLWLAAPLRAEEPVPAPLAAEVEGVIRHQIAAFRRDDAEGAFAFAAPNIRQRFGTAENFIAMVKESYPPVYRPAMVEFMDIAASPDGTMIRQLVFFTGRDGASVMGMYELERLGDGRLAITGCTLTPTGDRGI